MMIPTRSIVSLVSAASLSLSLLISSSSSIVSGVSAHSWLDCANWRFNDASAYTDANRQLFDNMNGQCLGYARRYEVGIKPFGKMDEVQFFRHFDQRSANDAPCRSTGAGSNEAAANPITAAYAPNPNVYGNAYYGAMTSVQAGDTLCWRWPAKNHASDTNMVFVNWATTAGVQPSSQSEFDAAKVGQMSFRQQCKPGTPSPGDQAGVGSELAACGGCFTVPQRSPGVYAVQWKWPTGNAAYVSCADIAIIAPNNTDCAASDFGPWSPCSSSCQGGTQVRTRTVTTAQRGTGKPCPNLKEEQQCNVNVSCTSQTQQLVVYGDSLNPGWSDWSWSDPRNFAATPAHSGTAAISFSPSAWTAIFLHSNTNTALDVKDYTELRFWINGGSVGGQALSMSLLLGATPMFSYTIPTSSIVANTWKEVVLVFANQGKTSGPFDGVWWQAQTGATQSNVLIDDIVFTKVSTAAGGGGEGVTTIPPTATSTPTTVTANFCASKQCPANSKCVNTASAAVCQCYGGYTGTDCSTAPSVSNVLVFNPKGDEITSFESSQLLTIKWSSTGETTTVSILLQSTTTTSSLPIYLASQYNNIGAFSWLVPNELANGNYRFIVQYSNNVRNQSLVLTKTSAASGTCVDVDCGTHGECNSGKCVCRFFYTGDKCDTAPPNVKRLTASIRIMVPYASYTNNRAAFVRNFAIDVAGVLNLKATDQVEVSRVVAAGTDGASCIVYFTVLLEGPVDGGFGTSALFAGSTTASVVVSVLLDKLNDPASNAQLGLMIKGATDVQVDIGGSTTTNPPTTNASDASITAAVSSNMVLLALIVTIMVAARNNHVY